MFGRICIRLKTTASRVFTALLAAGVCGISIPTQAQKQSDQIIVLSSLCRDPSLSFDQTIVQLQTRGWTTQLSTKDKKQGFKHLAAGQTFRSEKPRKSDYRSFVKTMPKTLGSNVRKLDDRTITMKRTLLKNSAGAAGFLIINEDIVRINATGEIKLRGRFCHAVLHPGPGITALKLLGTPGNRGYIDLPRSTIRHKGIRFALKGRQKSLPNAGLGFKPVATEYVLIQMVH